MAMNMNKVKIMLIAIVTVAIIGGGLNAVEVLAEELAVQPKITAVPTQATNASLIYPGGKGVENVDFLIQIQDLDSESVGGDIKTVVDGKEHVIKDAYTKTGTSYHQRITTQIPSDNLTPGVNDVSVSVTSHNADGTKTAESAPMVLKITKYQRYEVAYRNQRTSEELTVPNNTNFPKELIGPVGTSLRNRIIGTNNLSAGKSNEWYSFNQSLLGEESVKRVGNTANLYHELTYGNEHDGSVLTLNYELDVPEYYGDRGAELKQAATLAETNQVLKRTISPSEGNPYQQKVLFGPINGITEASLPYAESYVLGTGTNANPGNLYLNILNEYATNSFSVSQTGGATSNGKIAGLSIYTGGNKTTNTPLYLDPKHTEYYTSTNQDGDEVVTILSLAKPAPNDMNHKARYVVEYTAVLKQGTADVDVTVEVTNGTGEESELALMYQAPLQINGNIRGTSLSSTSYQPIRALGDNKGVYVETDGPTIRHTTRASLQFPDVENNGPESWMVGTRNINAYAGFSRGGTINTVAGTGLETGYTKAESIAAGNPSLEGTPYPTDYQIVPANGNNAVRFKSPLKNTKHNESVKMSWTMSYGDERLEAPKDSVYREMDKETGETLEGFDYVDKMMPIEVDTSKIDDVTDVKNYLVFGTQSALDTQTTINAQQRSDARSHLFAPYRKETVPFTFPRVISYKKDMLKQRPTSYSFQWSSGANAASYGGSGFGLATFDNHKTQNPVAADMTQSTVVEEVYLSDDNKTMKVYGKYTFQKGTNGKTESIPMKMTIESSNTKGKARFTMEYMNTLDYQSDFRAFYTVHMDINDKHESSSMYTLGGTKGVYFQEKNLQHLGADYYVAFYTSNTNNGVAPNDLNVFSFDKDLANGQTGTTAPLGWQVANGNEFQNLGKFDPSQPKGDVFQNREVGTGKLLGRKPTHPGWHFVYPTTTLATGQVGRADLEMKVTDLPEISYKPVEIKPETDKVAKDKTELTYEPKFSQDMAVDVKTQAHRPDNLLIEGTYMPYLDNVTEADFTVLKKDGKKIDPKYYDLTLDKTKGIVKVAFKDPAPVELIKETVIIQQSSKIRTDKDSQGITQYYDKTAGQFSFPIEAYNSWEIHDDSSEPRETQDPTTKANQLIAYRPDFGAKAVEGKEVTVGGEAGKPADYLKTVNKPDFDFDVFDVTFKDGVEPTFTKEGSQTVNIVVTSKEFGNSVEVPVTVKVTSDINMTVTYILTNKDQTESKLKDLTQDSLPEIGPTTPKKISTSDDIQKIINELESDEKIGYDRYQTLIRIGNSTTNASDLTKVPREDFTVELYYTGKVALDYPESFDFGKHKLSIFNQSDIRPKITKDNNDADDQMKMRVINTQGQGGVWDLYAEESQRMTLTKASGKKEEYKGHIYYIPEVGQEPIVFGNGGKIIQSDSSNAGDIMNVVPFLPADIKAKSGLFMTVDQGNSKGVYEEGEITWELRNAN